MEDDQGPACSHPSAAVHSNNLVEVVHSSFIAVIVEDDGWLPVLTITDFSCLVQYAQQGHMVDKKQKWWWE